MNKSKKQTLIYGGIIVLVVVGLFALGGKPNNPSPQPAAVSQIGINSEAPDFKLEDINGTTYTLSQYKNQNPVLLELFAVWCPHCQKQAEVTKKVAEDNADAGLVVLSVNSSPFGRFYTVGNNAPVTKNDLKWFLEQFNAHEPILFDDGAVGQTYGLKGFPTLVLVDKAGNIAWMGSGEISAEKLQAEINKILPQQ